MERNWVASGGQDVGQWSLSLPLLRETISCRHIQTNFRAYRKKQVYDNETAASSLPSCMSLYGVLCNSTQSVEIIQTFNPNSVFILKIYMWEWVKMILVVTLHLDHGKSCSAQFESLGFSCHEILSVNTGVNVQYYITSHANIPVG